MQNFTPRQRALLLGITGTLLAVVSIMGWSVWTTVRGTQGISLLPTPNPSAIISSPSAQGPTDAISPTPYFETARAGEISREVAEARGLMPRWETPLTMVDTHEMSVILYRRYQARIPFPLSERETLQAVGLWPGMDVQPDPVAQAQIATALYFPEEGQLYIKRDVTDLDTLETRIAYGYALALPDQYGDLARLRDEPSSLDRQIALDALAAGDACIAILRYAGIEPGTTAAATLLDAIADSTLPLWRTESPDLDRLARLPMEIGCDFATARYEAGGLEALNEAIRRPPRATEQLLHPEQYESWQSLKAFDPISVSLGTQWTLTHTETVGEAMMAFTLSEWGPETFTTTLDGWNGDLLQVWKGPESAETVLWQTAWDSDNQATTFEWQMREVLPSRVRELIQNQGTAPPEGLPPGKWWAGRWGSAFLRRYRNQVWLVWGNDLDAVKTIGAELP